MILQLERPRAAAARSVRSQTRWTRAATPDEYVALDPRLRDAVRARLAFLMVTSSPDEVLDDGVVLDELMADAIRYVRDMTDDGAT